MRHYELVVVLSPMINPDQATESWDRIKGFITGRQADINHEERWGTRRLAYPIRKGQYQFLEGNYHLTRFSTEQPFNRELETFLRLDDHVLRSMVTNTLPEDALAKQVAAQTRAIRTPPPRPAPVEGAAPAVAPGAAPAVTPGAAPGAAPAEGAAPATAPAEGAAPAVAPGAAPAVGAPPAASAGTAPAEGAATAAVAPGTAPEAAPSAAAAPVDAAAEPAAEAPAAEGAEPAPVAATEEPVAEAATAAETPVATEEETPAEETPGEETSQEDAPGGEAPAEEPPSPAQAASDVNEEDNAAPEATRES